MVVVCVCVFTVILVILVIDASVVVFVTVEQYFILQLMFAYGLAFNKPTSMRPYCHLR